MQQLYESLAKRRKSNGNPVFIFWDKKCLNYGQNWESGFLHGLNTSKCIILLLSIEVTQLTHYLFTDMNIPLSKIEKRHGKEGRGGERYGGRDVEGKGEGGER